MVGDLDWNDEFKFEDQYTYKAGKQWFGRQMKKAEARILHQNIEHMESGFFYNWRYEVPEPCMNFVADQLMRFGFPLSDRLCNVLVVAAECAITYCGGRDPYVMFTRGLSDIDLTDEWQTHAYQVQKEIAGGRIIYREPKPGDAESYRLNIPQGMMVFQNFMKSPFLGYAEAIQGKGIGDWFIDDNGNQNMRWRKDPHPLHDIAWELQDLVLQRTDDMEPEIGAEAYEELRDVCRRAQPGGIPIVDIRRMEMYFEMAAWASFVWLMSPHSVGWRCYHNRLVSAVHEEGEALLVGYTIFGRGEYKKTQRPVESCFHCHIQSWCLSDKLEAQSLVKICEHCCTDGMPLIPPSNCGTRICRMPQCRHHPMHSFDPNRRLHETMRSSGALMGQIGQNPALASHLRKLLT